MKCLKCKKTFKDTLDKCPFCHTKVNGSSDVDFKDNIELIEKMEQELSKTIELKTTKRKIRDNREVSLDETVAINVLNDNNFTLLDEINKQIDNINEEAQEELKKYDDSEIDVELPPERVAEIQNKLNALKVEYEKLATELKDVILMNITDSMQIEVLKLRYAQGLAWNDVINRMGYTERTIYRYHSKALAILDEIRYKN